MNLSQCMQSNIFEGDIGFFQNFQTCVSGWLFRTTTDFYESSDLVLPWWFGVLCFSYTIRVVVDYFIAPKWHKRTCLPLVEIFLLLGCAQGILSFAADYMNMTNNSLIHVFDRLLAMPNFIIETLKILYSYNFVRSETFLISVSCLPLACFFFLKSSEAQVAQDVDGFIFWHNMWHLIPLTTVPLHIVEYMIRGELEYSKCKQYDDSRPPLLSSIVMSKSMEGSFLDDNYKAKKIRRRTRKE